MAFMRSAVVAYNASIKSTVVARIASMSSTTVDGETSKSRDLDHTMSFWYKAPLLGKIFKMQCSIFE